MSKLEALFLGSSKIFFEEDAVSLTEIESLLSDTATLDHFTERGILQFVGRHRVKMTFVGAIVANKRVIYILPKYLKSAAETGRIESGYYIRVIKKYVEYSAKKSARKPVGEYLDDISLLMRTFDNLDCYYQKYGSFKERSATFTRDERGSVNWTRTIQSVVPVHVTCEADGGIYKPISTMETVFYPSPVGNVTGQHEGLISLIFKSVLTLLATLITPLLDRPHPLCLGMRQDSVSSILSTLDVRRSYYARVVAQRIPREFGQRRTVLSSLLAFLRAEASILDGAIRNKAFAFGVRKFSAVWEDACIRAVGGERGSRELAKITWRPRTGSGGEYHSRIDAKVAAAGSSRIILVDAKYHAVSVADADMPEVVERMIPSYDVVKQFGYMMSYHLGTGCKLEDVESAFICPEVGGSDHSYIGKIGFERMSLREGAILSTLRSITVYGVRPECIFDAYLIDVRLPELVAFLGADHNVTVKTFNVRKHRRGFSIMMRQDEFGIKVVGAGGKSRIPWLEREEVARVRACARDYGVGKILDDMNRNRENRDTDGFIIKDDELVQSFDAGKYLLGGDDVRVRRAIQVLEQ